LSPLVSHWRASPYVQRRERAHRNEDTTQHHSALALVFRWSAEGTIRGGGKPYSNMALICRLEEWARRPELPHGSSPWVKAQADAHDCIMVRIKRSYRIQVCDARSAPRASFPSDYQSDMQCVPSDAPASKSPISLVILPLRAQASKPAPGLNRGRCETQAPLSGKPPSFASVSVP
jgi:hypothetical protein